ncbi:hypothetical protein IF799_12935, partial [Citrobacter freundii]|nr:hypothetical protein [Citrobacter freundii]
MEWHSWIGYLAATLTTLSFLPQAIKVITTRNTQGISGVFDCLTGDGTFRYLSSR